MGLRSSQKGFVQVSLLPVPGEGPGLLDSALEGPMARCGPIKRREASTKDFNHFIGKA